LDVAHGVPPGGLPVAIREVRRMSFFLHKNCGQVPVVNGERRRHHRLRTPWGTSSFASQRHPRKFSGPPCRAVCHRNVVARYRTKCQALPRTSRPRSVEGFSNRLRETLRQRCDASIDVAAARAERGRRRRAGLSGCWSCDLVVVRRVAGTATGWRGSRLRPRRLVLQEALHVPRRNQPNAQRALNRSPNVPGIIVSMCRLVA
jgi:hypothetical protein